MAPDAPAAFEIHLDEGAVSQTIRKNLAASYGLTVVVGLPFSAPVCGRIRRIQQQVESLASGRFTWYAPDRCHATLVAPLRGLYREGPPLQRAELPADLQGFSADLAQVFAQSRPFILDLAGLALTPEGILVIRENTLAQRLSGTFRHYPELDQPKHSGGLGVVIGYLQTAKPFATPAEAWQFADVCADLDARIGRQWVRRAWLVHYANRTLSRIVGKISFPMGENIPLTADRLIEELGIQ